MKNKIIRKAALRVAAFIFIMRFGCTVAFGQVPANPYPPQTPVPPVQQQPPTPTPVPSNPVPSNPNNPNNPYPPQTPAPPAPQPQMPVRTPPYRQRPDSVIPTPPEFNKTKTDSLGLPPRKKEELMMHSWE